jgi:hypothetical protein
MTENFGHRTARAGDWSRPGDAPAGDGIANLVKYALGLNAVTFGSQGRLIAGTTSATNHRFLSVTYTRPDPPPTGLTYAVEQSPSLCSSLWTTNGTIVLSNAVNSGLRTITTRDKEPIGATPQRFLRFKLSPP